MTDPTWCRSQVRNWTMICVLPFGHAEMHRYVAKEEAQRERWTARSVPKKPEDPRCPWTKRKGVVLEEVGQTILIWRCILDDEHDGSHLFPVLPVNA